MSISLKNQVIALSVMCGTGVGAPAAAYAANLPQARVQHAQAQLDPVMEASSAVLVAAATYVAVVEREAVSSLLKLEPAPTARWMGARAMAAKPQAPLWPPPLKGQCFTHRSQTLSAGSVRVCDIKRTPNGHGRTLFTPAVKPRRLAPRGFISPTGLTR
jgi:hypothetical protein